MSSNKQQRRRQLARQIEKNPFLTDEELAELFLSACRRFGWTAWNWGLPSTGSA